MPPAKASRAVGFIKRAVTTGWDSMARAWNLDTGKETCPPLTCKANATTAMGAMIFFWARLAYAVIYLIGIPWLRTLAWFVSVIGMVMIAWVLLQAM